MFAVIDAETIVSFTLIPAPGREDKYRGEHKSEWQYNWYRSIQKTKNCENEPDLTYNENKFLSLITRDSFEKIFSMKNKTNNDLNIVTGPAVF